MYERLLKERERVITALADEVDYLRAQLAMRGTHVPGAATNPSEQIETGVSLFPQAPTMEVKNFITDEELDAQAIAESEGLNEAQMREVLDSLGLQGEISIDNWNVN